LRATRQPIRTALVHRTTSSLRVSSGGPFQPLRLTESTPRRKCRVAALVAEYEFLTTWVVDAAVPMVWDVIVHPARWPDWWKGVKRVVEVDPGDDTGLGSVYDHWWQSVIPYTVDFRTTTTGIDKPHLIEAQAAGKLTGVGRWRFFEGSATAVTYEWRVRTTPAWMNAVAPVARPVFEWNHNVLMRRGGAGLARLLGAPLLAEGYD
jgi:hypothetical protein